MAYNSDANEPFGNFAGLTPWERPHGHVPPYPLASNLVAEDRAPHTATLAGRRSGFSTADREPMTPESEGLRDEIRRMVLEELGRIVRS